MHSNASRTQQLHHAFFATHCACLSPLLLLLLLTLPALTNCVSRCLCFPQVTYEAATQASKLGLDFLGLLLSCRKGANSTAPFSTQWASAEGTFCPDIPFDARPGDLMLALGDAVIIPSSRSRSRWAWANLRQFGEVVGKVVDLSAAKARLTGSQTLQLLMLLMICMPPVFLLLHRGVLMPASPAYRALGPTGQLVTCQHAVYALVFTLSVVPQAVLAFQALFSAWTGSFLSSAVLPVLVGVFLSTRAVLYLIEASVRCVVKWSWLLVTHHLLFYTVVVMAYWTQSPVVVGIGLVLDLFAACEFPLYWALLAYRLQWQPSAARAILRGACAWYVVTRVMQTVLLVYMVVSCATIPAVRLAPEFLITAIMCAAFTFIQAYTLVIYRGMDVRLGDRLAAAATAATAGAAGGAQKGGGGGLVGVAQADRGHGTECLDDVCCDGGSFVVVGVEGSDVAVGPDKAGEGQWAHSLVGSGPESAC